MSTQKISPEFVPDLREASRHLVRELGFMNRTLAGTRLTPSAVHAIIELGTAGELAAKGLAEKLILEKSTVSRLLASLTANGQVRELRSKTDGRQKILRLSVKGKNTLRAINRFAERQVATALELLNERARREILSGIRKYAEALRRSRESADVITLPEGLVIKPDYTPTLIGSIVEMHAAYYSRLVNFGAAFEAQVAAGLADFVARLSCPDNAIWSDGANGAVVGSVAIDGEDLGRGKAHLRWFILGEPARGTGLGKRLLQTAVVFCDERGFAETHLWTFKGLDAARHLYETQGFRLAEEYSGTRWGAQVREQRFVRERNAPS